MLVPRVGVEDRLDTMVALTISAPGTVIALTAAARERRGGGEVVWGSEVRGLLQPFLLLLIYERPSHGYDLIERLAGMGVMGVEPGHAYRVLRSLERERLLTSRWVPSEAGPARRLYELTPAGAADLKNRMENLAEFGSVVDAFLSLWGKCQTPDRRTQGTRNPAVAFSRP